MAARLVDREAADMVELGREAAKPLGERPSPKPGLALGMGVDDPHRAQSFAPGQEAHQARKVASLRFAIPSCEGLKPSKAFRCKAYSSWPTSVIRRLK